MLATAADAPHYMGTEGSSPIFDLGRESCILARQNIRARW
jgi:hypothetical protein